MGDLTDKAIKVFAGRHIKSSILQAPLTVLGMIFFAALIMPDQRDLLVKVTIFIVIPFIFIWFSYFAIKEPERLHSEKYQTELLNHQRQLIQLKQGETQPLTIENLPISANPDLVTPAPIAEAKGESI